MKTDNKLYWKTATEPVENIVVRLVLDIYADNDNLYVGLEKISGESPECWETYTDITVNCNALPSFHAYVDSRDCNRHVYDFLVRNRIAEPTGHEYQGFRMFRFNPERLKELSPEQFGSISLNSTGQEHTIKEFVYREERFPLRIIRNDHGKYLIATERLEKALEEGVRNLDATANELLESICLFCSGQELHSLTDTELIERINGQYSEHQSTSVMKKEYKESIQKYAIYLIDEKMREYDDTAIGIAIDAYKDGLNDAISLLWHDVKEPPAMEKDILAEDATGRCRTVKFHPEKWNDTVKAFKVKRWAYMDDLIPGKIKQADVIIPARQEDISCFNKFQKS
ncbi:DUF4313 domain-containing protein [Bacteroides uniformis]|uniref:DUF4313 domain-containing protein n=1 Tax=Bacteroides uniformis TaxID=820 RepID=A0AA37JWU7_BACUN|nr:DUF4313 domain-containing protein [Bacteroides uniformis]GKH13624.1 hypothetical protein CE91St12_18340 [Bacteroides uniformis]GKH36963.1 hypothetical protein CE91St13_18340 [Bacteroides uniformis]